MQVEYVEPVLVVIKNATKTFHFSSIRIFVKSTEFFIPQK